MLPLPALVAFDTPRLALCMLALEPRLRGVALSAPVGSGKSALLRGFSALIPDLPIIDLPLGSDQEALLGGLDIEATLRQGKRVFRDGLFARANGSALIAEACNLLPEQTINLLLGALDEGCVRIERDGVSRRIETRFRLLTSFDPAEGNPRAHLLDRVGLIVTLPRIQASAARREILQRHLHPNSAEWTEELELLRALIDSARQALADIIVTKRVQRQLINAALALGIEGHRADQFARLATCASAALALRSEISDDDVETAIKLVLLPRATRLPQQDSPPEPSIPDQLTPNPESAPTDLTDERDTAASAEPIDEVLEAIAVNLTDTLDQMHFVRQRGGRSGSRGAVEGSRGRHISSVPDSIRRKRLDVIATLRAASRWQKVRAKGHTRVAIKAEDFRIKRFRSKAGSLFIFAVDASGSMALNRMRQAKGAVHALLSQAYINRDKVALVTFRGDGADLLLPPTNSVELLRRAVDQIPTGGGTPVAATILRTLEVAEQARRKGFKNVSLVMLTDGRANVALKGDRAMVEQELEVLCRSVIDARINALIIDTQRSFLSHSPGEKLAKWLSGQYLYLPNASAGQLTTIVKQGLSCK
jgi:magnesium chelatase subunit D